MADAKLWGVWAKYERALEQLQSLHKEVLAFGKQPHPYTIVSQVDDEGSHYVFAFKPDWPANLQDRWGAITGEIVHDLRSALEQLVWQLVLLNDGEPGKMHTFPICDKQPSKGFAVEMRREWTDRRGRLGHGPLFGMSDAAVALIESCQPYRGPDGARLRQLHDLWNMDKHETLIPTTLWAPAPEIKLTNALLYEHPPDRFVGDTYVMEFTVARGDPPPDPRVQVEPHAPVDIKLRDGGEEPVIEVLRLAIKVVLTGLLFPAAEMFPEGSGMRLPF